VKLVLITKSFEKSPVFRLKHGPSPSYLGILFSKWTVSARKRNLSFYQKYLFHYAAIGLIFQGLKGEL
jgi:hypothetical protein